MISFLKLCLLALVIGLLQFGLVCLAVEPGAVQSTTGSSAQQSSDDTPASTPPNAPNPAPVVPGAQPPPPDSAPRLPIEIDDQVPVPEPSTAKPSESSADADSESDSLRTQPKSEQAEEPPPPSLREILDVMGEAELRGIFDLIKSNYVAASKLDDAELARVRIQGLITREEPAMQILPRSVAQKEVETAPYKSAVLREFGYLRLGPIEDATLERLDTTLQDFQAAGIQIIGLDLRASGKTGDANVAAAILRRFVSQGAEMFRLARSDADAARIFTATAEPLYRGTIILLVDSETRGAAELIAATLRAKREALVVGSRTAGELYEYADVPLKNGHVLRYAVSQVFIGDEVAKPGEGITPDVPVPFDPKDKWQKFKIADEKGIAAIVVEKERPRMNEAALVAGRNPELAELEDITNGGERSQIDPETIYDRVLQRALDLAATIPVLGQ